MRPKTYLTYIQHSTRSTFQEAGDESLSMVKSLPGEALTLFQSKAFYRDLKKTLPKDLDILLSELKVKDIIHRRYRD